MKRLLAFTVLSAAVCIAFAQQHLTEAFYPNDIVNTIVREYNYPATVSYIETYDEHYFAYSDLSMQSINASIPNNLFVKDIFLLDDIAFFCGFSKSQTVTAVWGWFDINGLINSSFTYHLYDGFTCNNYTADTLYSLAAFTLDDRLHVAVVGSCSDGSDREACVLDISGTALPSSTWNYSMGVTNTPPTHERLTKVCLTDNYVVACGSKISCCEDYRFFLRSAMFSSSGPQDTVYYFPAVLTYTGTGSIQNNHGSSDLALTPVFGDMFASATNLLYSPNYYTGPGFLVNVYDIPTVLSAAGGIAPTFTATVDSMPVSFIQIMDMRYSTTTSTISILMQSTFNGAILSLDTELPMPLTAANLSLLLGTRLFSLDNYNSQILFLAQGLDSSYPYILNSLVQPYLTTAPSCTITASQAANEYTYWSKSDYMPLLVCSYNFSCKEHDPINYTTIPIIKKC